MSNTTRFISHGGMSGMRGSRAIDLTGMVFNGIRVIERYGSYDNSGNSIWKCECFCGKVFTAASYIIRHRKRSCGCLRKRKFLDQAFGQYVSQIKSDAKDRGLEFILSEQEIYQINQKDCYYCGKPPSSCKSAKQAKYVYNGIDRYDNSKGYTLENCVPCCTMCNVAKHHHSAEDFLHMVHRIAAKHPLTLET